MFSNTRYFLRKLDTLISGSFFYSQSRFTELLKDYYHSLKNRINPTVNFEIIKDRVEIDKFQINEKDLIFRSDFSKMIDYEKIPDFVEKIINLNKTKIEKFLGKNFLVTKCKFYRTFSFDKWLSKHDIISNIWHQDSHDGYKMINIFVLVSNIKKDDGPFIFLDRNNTKRYWSLIGERWTFDKTNADKSFQEEINFVGNKGEYILINTSNCLHRASIPNSKRDMIQITLYPSWRKRNNREVFSTN